MIGADILYEPALYGDIVRLLERTVQPGGQAILTDPARTHAGRFVDDLRIGWVDGRCGGAPGAGITAMPAIRNGAGGRYPGGARLAQQAVEDEGLVRLGGGTRRLALAAFGRGGFLGLGRFKRALDSAAGDRRGERAGERQSDEGLQHHGA